MIPVCHAILNNWSANALAPSEGFTHRSHSVLEDFLQNVQFTTSRKDRNGRVINKPKRVRNITKSSAETYKFQHSDGGETTVAQYLQSQGTNLQYPRYICIKTSKGAVFPIELCSIIPGQLMRVKIPSHLTESVLKFTSQGPDQRLDSIVAGYSVLQYGQSEYMRHFEMSVSQTPESCLARVLPTPVLSYGTGSKSEDLTPSNGSWNMQHQKFFQPTTMTGWALLVYDGVNIGQPEVDFIIQGLKSQADLLGIKGFNSNPPVSFPSAQVSDVHSHLLAAGGQVFRQTKAAPSLIVVVMPRNSAKLYQAVKHFGDVKRGVATQCLLGSKAKTGCAQYFANVWLKINAKLGGINSVLAPSTHKFLSDSMNPVMIIGSKVMHPDVLLRGHPSFPAVVSSIDSHATRYTAVSSPQEYRAEMILDLENMIYELIHRHVWWKTHQEYKEHSYPKRIIFYRSGVSEGQFSRVLAYELKSIKDACKRHDIDPTITIVVVSKGHHVRFFPTHGMEDRGGNCPAGTVVDDVVGHPNEFDFYLQSHSGSAGTSRPTHYNVLYDENNFTQDSLQSLSFALCHVYTRATCSVSIPAPLYYADIVSKRGKNHFDPSLTFTSVVDESINGGYSSPIEKFKELYQPAHESMRYKMFFT